MTRHNLKLKLVQISFSISLLLQPFYYNTTFFLASFTISHSLTLFIIISIYQRYVDQNKPAKTRTKHRVPSLSSVDDIDLFILYLFRTLHLT